MLEWGREKDAETGEGRTAEQKKTEIRQIPKERVGQVPGDHPLAHGASTADQSIFSCYVLLNQADTHTHTHPLCYGRSDPSRGRISRSKASLGDEHIRPYIKGNWGPHPAFAPKETISPR